MEICKECGKSDYSIVMFVLGVIIFIPWIVASGIFGIVYGSFNIFNNFILQESEKYCYRKEVEIQRWALIAGSNPIYKSKLFANAKTSESQGGKK